jgi:hypothetical protein
MADGKLLRLRLPGLDKSVMKNKTNQRTQMQLRKTTLMRKETISTTLCIFPSYRTTVDCRVWSGESADCGLGSVEYKEWNVEWGVLSGEC